MVEVDPRMAPGRIFVPSGVAQMPVNKVGTGPVDVVRLEEVHSA
jgi:hypothetical protein